MTVDVEERIRGTLHEVAAHVEYDDDVLELELVPSRRRRPVRGMVVAGLAAASVAVVVALVVSSTASHHSSPATVSVGSSTTDGGTTTTLSAPSDPATSAALGLWSSFPVDAQPRPVVLSGESTVGPARGFTNPDIGVADAEKNAFEARELSPPPSVPSGPATAGGFPIIGPSEAFERLRSEGTGTASTTLETTDVHLGTGSFLTDRGRRTLPAWLFSFRDVEDPVAVLAIASEALFPTPNGSAPPPRLDASTTTGSRTVELSFTGSKEESGPCGVLYTAYVSESANAVAVSVVQVPQPSTTTTPISSGQTMTGCVGVGSTRHVVVTLHEPLGARVLVDATTNSAVGVAVAA